MTQNRKEVSGGCSLIKPHTSLSAQPSPGKHGEATTFPLEAALLVILTCIASSFCLSRTPLIHRALPDFTASL